ncbi:hypothetical protein ACJX0J_012087, partial [Zea mays]
MELDATELAQEAARHGRDQARADASTGPPWGSSRTRPHDTRERAGRRGMDEGEAGASLAATASKAQSARARAAGGAVEQSIGQQRTERERKELEGKLRDGDKKVNVDPDDDSDWLHRNETFQSNDYVAMTHLLTPGSVHDSVGVIGEPGIDVREYRLEHLRLYNQTPKQKEAKIEYMIKHRALQADTLNVASIAMEDPTYTPKVVHLTTDATEPDRSSSYRLRLGFPEFIRTPFLPAQTQTEDVGSFDMSSEAIR